MSPGLGFRRWSAWVSVLLACGSILSCGSSSGGSGGRLALLDLEFPDPSGQSGADAEVAPRNASLVQQVVFVFSGSPDGAAVSAMTLQVRDSQGLPVKGFYKVSGNRVIFTPDLPLRDLDEGASGGLRAGATYSVEVVAGVANSLPGLAGFSTEVLAEFPHPAQQNGVLALFTTTTDPALFLSGLAPRPVRLSRVTPRPTGQEIGPFLYSDPGNVFPRSEVISLEFDGPLHPGDDNLGPMRFRLVDMDALPGGLDLGSYATLVENGLDRSRVELRPSGILPFGASLALEVPRRLRHLGDPAPAQGGREIVAEYRTASAPAGTVRDRYHEDFDTGEYLDEVATRETVGVLPADWNRDGNGILQAAAAFPGAGELGPFVPPFSNDTVTIVFDTNSQSFPFLDGSTPGAQPGVVVNDGVFNFTDIIIPSNVTIEGTGTNPLVFTATGRVEIGGMINVSGKSGTTENSYDSGVFPIPGGNGGVAAGRGGRSHVNVFFPPGSFRTRDLVTPTWGEDGFSAPLRNETGGRGGQSGILDDPDLPNPELLCDEGGRENRGRGAWGGGGSFLNVALRGRNGLGNMIPQADGTWINEWPDVFLEPGQPGDAVFVDGDAANDFIGQNGEWSDLFGGQGGGGGGSKAEGYHCGRQFPWGRDEFKGAFPDTTGDSRGGGGGGGGGVLVIRALEGIELKGAARILARGGIGGGGEVTGDSRWGGAAGGGSGGLVILESALSVTVDQDATIAVNGGGGDRTTFTNCVWGCGGHGIVQLQAPLGEVASAVSTSMVPETSWVDADNTRNPAQFTPQSMAVSRWIDVGRVTQRPPVGTNPVFRFFGTDGNGEVTTDPDGTIPDAQNKPFEIDYLGRLDPASGNYFPGEEPRENWIPPTAEVIIEFQAGDAVVEGSREVNPASLSAWSPRPSIANGRQFIRWRVRFDVERFGGGLDESSKRPVFQRFDLSFEF